MTQPGFLADRGDDFLRGTPASEHDELYRCASLRAAGVPLGLSSDAPYGPVDPWVVMRAAVRRRTRSGAVVGPGERLTAAQALDGYLSPGNGPAMLRAASTWEPGRIWCCCTPHWALRSTAWTPGSSG